MAICLSGCTMFDPQLCLSSVLFFEQAVAAELVLVYPCS